MFVSDITTVPSEHGHTVLNGHRDTVFTELGELQEKDTLIIEYDKKFILMKFKNVDYSCKWSNRHSEKEEPTLTLTTCYPFDYIGDAPDRYIVEAKLIATDSRWDYNIFDI